MADDYSNIILPTAQDYLYPAQKMQIIRQQEQRANQQAQDQRAMNQQNMQVNAFALQHAQRQSEMESDPQYRLQQSLKAHVDILKSLPSPEAQQRYVENTPILNAYFSQNVPRQGPVQQGQVLPPSGVTEVPRGIFQPAPKTEAEAKIFAARNQGNPLSRQYMEAFQKEKSPPTLFQTYLNDVRAENPDWTDAQVGKVARERSAKDAIENKTTVINVGYEAKKNAKEAEMDMYRLRPEDYELQADGVSKGGAMPSFGNGPAGAANRQGFYKALNKKVGTDSTPMLMSKLQLKADAQGLGILAKQQAVTSTLENTVGGLFDQIYAMAPTLPPSMKGKYRTLNELAGAYNNNFEGDPIARDYYGKVYEAVTDYNRVMTGQLGIAAATDASQAMANKILLSTADSPATLKRLIGPVDNQGNGSMRTNMKTRTDGQAAGINAIFKKYGYVPQSQEPVSVSGMPPTPQAGGGQGANVPMDSMPPAAQFTGKTIDDTVTGQAYRSDGKSWTRIK